MIKMTNLKITLWFTIMLLATTGWSQHHVVSTADDFNLWQDSFMNGSDWPGQVTIGHATFINNYDTMWNSWSGFAISNMGDTTTPGFLNQYSSWAGSGARGKRKLFCSDPPCGSVLG